MTLRLRKRQGARRHPARDTLLETELLRLWILSLPPGAHIKTVRAPQ
jgi:hypothetical protein